MSRSTPLVVVALTLLVGACCSHAAESIPDAAAKISEQWSAKEFGELGKLKINRAWPIRYGLVKDDRQKTDGWQLAAGQAVYAAKCASCHGDDGSGRGPQAKKLSPLPRDFRRGIFKFHSGGWNRRPSRHDFAETLRLGLPGTAMPAFDKLSEAQRDAVVEYVRWLSMRGEFAHNMAQQLRGDFDDPTEADADELKDYAASARENVQALWNAVDAERLPASAPPRMTAASIARGEALFQGDKFACFKCHAKDGRGVKFADDARFLDQWGNRQIMVDLTKGTFKGGDGPRDFYARIRGGIPGSAHPAYEFEVERAGSDAALWDVVHYVYHLAGKQPAAAAHARRAPPKDDEVEETAEEDDESSDDDDEEIATIVAKGWGKIEGRILYGGREIPPRRKLPVTKDAAAVGIESVLDPSLVVNADNFGVANVVVGLDLRQAEGYLPVHESQREPPQKAALLVSRELQFQPHVVVVRIGQMLAVRNEDPIGENFSFTPSRNSAFNYSLPAGGDAEYQFKVEERRPLPVVSAIHPWMQSFLVVKSHPYVAVTDESGAFALDQVPAGVWQVQLWHERVGSIDAGEVKRGGFEWRDTKLFVTVEPDAAASGEIVIDAELFGR